MSLSYLHWSNSRSMHVWVKKRNEIRDLIKNNSAYSLMAEFCGCSESSLRKALGGGVHCSSKRLRLRIFQALLIYLHRETNSKLLEYMDPENYDDYDVWLALSPAMEKVHKILNREYDFDSIDGDSNSSANDPVRVLRLGKR